MRFCFIAAAAFALLLGSALAPAAAGAETPEAAEHCGRRIVPIAEADAALRACDDFAEPRALRGQAPPLDAMTARDLAAARAAGAEQVCVRGPVRLTAAPVPAEVRFEARVEPASHEFYMPRAIVRVGWSVRAADGDWSARVVPDGWAVEAGGSVVEWMRLPDAAVTAGDASARAAPSMRAGPGGAVWFDIGPPRPPAALAAEPADLRADAESGGARGRHVRIVRAGAEWAASDPVAIDLLPPAPPAGFLDAYAEHMDAAHARLLVIHRGVAFDAERGRWTVRGVRGTYFGIGSAFHIGDGYWLTTRHRLADSPEPEFWLMRGRSVHDAMRSAMWRGYRAGGTSISGTFAPARVHGALALVGWSAKRDLALFRGPEPVGGAALELDAAGADPGDRVLTAQGTRGAVTGDDIRADEWLPGSIAVSAATWRGMSGGPVLSSCGRAIGLVAGGDDLVAETWLIPSDIALDIIPRLRGGLIE